MRCATFTEDRRGGEPNAPHMISGSESKPIPQGSIVLVPWEAFDDFRGFVTTSAPGRVLVMLAPKERPEGWIWFLMDDYALRDGSWRVIPGIDRPEPHPVPKFAATDRDGAPVLLTFSQRTLQLEGSEAVVGPDLQAEFERAFPYRAPDATTVTQALGVWFELLPKDTHIVKEREIITSLRRGLIAIRDVAADPSTPVWFDFFVELPDAKRAESFEASLSSDGVTCDTEKSFWSKRRRVRITKRLEPSFRAVAPFFEHLCAVLDEHHGTYRTFGAAVIPG